MTEYWVSQAKYYCKFCNMWMADNKISRQNHDSGPKHKASVEIFNRKKREEKLHGAKNEKDLQQQLAAIDRAATLAMVQDIAASGPQTSSSIGPTPHPSMINRQHNPPQASAPASHAGPPGAAPNWSMPPPAVRQQYNVPFQVAKPLSEAAMKAVSENLRKDESGSYTVRGVKYLEGPYYEHRLKAGVACEVFVDELDDWMPGKVSRRYNPDLATKTPLRFDIAYSVTSTGSGEATEHVALSVSSDLIRLIDTPPVAHVDASGRVQPIAAIDENTGLGKWTTVSVTEINEEEEAKKRKAAAMEEEEERKQAEIEKKKKEKWDELDGIGRDDALGSFDPYNTGMYKGVAVSTEVQVTELKPISDGKEVEFKKRKLNNRKGTRVTSFD